ncbi:hypothetical protein EV2_011242 [Malus domestica]
MAIPKRDVSQGRPMRASPKTTNNIITDPSTLDLSSLSLRMCMCRAKFFFMYLNTFQFFLPRTRDIVSKYLTSENKKRLSSVEGNTEGQRNIREKDK